jgi:hypothetical protein
MVNLWLASCLLIAPAGVCNAEVQGDHSLVISPALPDWATRWCITHIAHIVASEAGGVPDARLAVACTIAGDIERGYTCRSLTPDRWKGYGTPDALDYEAVYAALSGGCDSIPEFRYLGNLNDARYWLRTGVIQEHTQPLSLWLGPGGAAVVGIP